MASIVEKYEQILAADPRSRIFVELAKALLEKGAAARVVQICERGMEHHPGSILGRVIWGRALLDLNELKAAMDQFEIAIALEPGNPYAFNLVGEALLQKGHPKEAIPVLARAAELQPADHRVQELLDEAMRRHREILPSGEPMAAPALASPAFPDRPEPEPEDERTEPYRSLAGPKKAAAESAARGEATKPAAPDPSAKAAAPAPDAKPPAQLPEDPEFVQEVTGAEGRPLPPAAATAAPPPLRRAPPKAPSALDFIPGGREENAAPAVAPTERPRMPGPKTLMTKRVAATEAAAQYEHELRAKAMKEVESERPSFWHRNRTLVLLGALGLIGAATGGVFYVVSERQATAAALHAGDRAGAGLARDTRAALGQALEVLLKARERRSGDPVIASLAAQVATVLAVDHEDGKARELLSGLATAEGAGDGAIVARWALAATKAERREAEEAVLAAEPSSAPLLQAIAGRILVERGELEAGRGRLEIAARATPPLLRAVVDLGDLSLASGDAQAALASYSQAIAGHATHPLAVAGAAEARLLLERDLELSRREIAAVDADAGSAAPPKGKLRFELAAARVLAATGDPPAAAERLKKAAQTLGKSVRLSTALAEIHLAGCAWDRAEAEARRAVELMPKDPEGRILLARARIGRRDYAGALATTENLDTRSAHLQRAIARFERGELDKAREELEKTQRDGKLTAEAAVWYALTDLALKRTDKAAALLEKLTGTPNPPPLAFVALGRVRAAEAKPDEAEKAWRTAVKREPRLPEAHAALGLHLLRSGRAAEAVEPLSRAVALDGSRFVERTALAEARVASGDPARARADLDLVLSARPKDPDALRIMASAWLAEKSFGEARRLAERAAAAAPKDPRPLLIGAKAALQAGERGAAKKLADRALRLAPAGATADEAKKLAAEAAGRKK